MSAPKEKRCPNIAWAFWTARKLNLEPRERLIFMAIAERADADLYCSPTQAEIAMDTGLSLRTANATVQDLLHGRMDENGERHNPPGCLEAERFREGLRYKLIREVPGEKPPTNGRSDTQIPDIRIRKSRTGFAHPKTQKLRLPLMKESPLEEKEESLYVSPASRSENVVADQPQQPLVLPADPSGQGSGGGGDTAVVTTSQPAGTSSQPEQNEPDQSRPGQQARQMVAIYNEIIAGTPLRRSRGPVSAELIADLERTINAPEFRRRGLSAWRTYCQLLTEDPHCRGERNGIDYPNWTANLGHALEPHVIQRMLRVLRDRREAKAMDRRIAASIAAQNATEKLAIDGLSGYDPAKEGSAYFQQTQRDPKAMAELDKLAASITYSGGLSDEGGGHDARAGH